MTEIIVWRHGQTDYNAQQRIQGQVDIPLNEVGLAQAEHIAHELAALAPQRIFSSPLQRAQATAHALGSVLGLKVGVDEALTERSFGLWEGLSGKELEAGWPEECARWRAGNEPQGVGVEPRTQVSLRVGGGLLRLANLAEIQGVERIVAVSHGAALKGGVCHLLGLDSTAWHGLRGLDNCHYGVLRRSSREPGWEMRAWNLG